MGGKRSSGGRIGRTILKRRILLFAAGGLVLLMTLLTATAPLSSSATFLHVELGARVHELGPFLTEEPMLFTSGQAPSATTWLADLALFLVNDLGGAVGLRLLAGLVAAVLLGGIILHMARRSRGAWYLTLAVVLASYLLLPRLHPSPELLGLPLFLLLSVQFAGEADHRSWPTIVTGFLLAVLLANLDPRMLLALVALQTAYLVLQLPRFLSRAGLPRLGGEALAWTALASGLLLTPRGIELPAFLAGRLRPRSFLWEDARRTFMDTNDSWWTVLAVTVIGGIVLLDLAGHLFLDRPRDERAQDRAVLASSLLAVAGGILLDDHLWLLFPPLLVSLRREAPLAEALAARRMDPSTTERSRRWGALLAVALLLAPLPAMPRVQRTWEQLFTPGEYSVSVDPDALPVDAASFLEEAGIEGRMFHEPRWGGFLAHTVPGSRIFLDTRRLGTSPHAEEAAREILAGGEEAARILRDYGVAVAVLRNDRPAPGRSGQWARVFRNRLATVYLHRTPESLDLFVRASRYYRQHSIPQHVAEGFEEAVVLEASPTWAREHRILAPAVLRQALELYAEMHRTPEKEAWVRVLRRLGNLYARLGLYDSALREWTRALQIRQRDRNLLFNIGVTQIRLEMLEDARRTFQTYMAHYPDDVQAERVLRALDKVLAY